MRIVFSRKGFDSSAGGCPSPIIDGRPLSLPIPTKSPTVTRFSDLAGPLPEAVTHLTNGHIRVSDPCHIDPDVDFRSITASRPIGWRGALGQVGSAQSHLTNQGVAVGDVFLFWGLFREAHQINGKWSFYGRSHHRIFAWMQIAEIHAVVDDGSIILSQHPWLAQHPHAREGWRSGKYTNGNTIYIAEQTMKLWPGADIEGYGVLTKGWQLTAKNSQRKSDWTVPEWLDPRFGGTGLSFHPHPGKRWLDNEVLGSAGRGQEFVTNIGERKDSIDWLRNIIEEQ